MGRIATASGEITGLIACAAAAFLFWLFSRYKPHTPAYSKGLFLLVLLTGTLIRAVLAWNTPSNYDRECWQIAADIFDRGGNIYAESERYRYTPVWFWVLGVLQEISRWIPAVSFTVLTRLFLTAVDLGTALVLWKWPKLSAWERARQASFFYLNPVSFLLTGVHGQFENLSIFFLVLAVRLAVQPVLNESGHRRVWLYATAAFVIKHITVYGLILIIRHLFPRVRAMRQLLVSAAIFAASFLPYWSGAEQEIVQNVLLYKSYSMPYGLASLDVRWLAPLFAVALGAYSFKLMNRRLSTKMMLGALFFLTFTPGFGVQYLVLPIAFGALRVSRGFFIFTAVAAAHLLGSPFNLGLPVFAWVPLWSVWAAAAYWWASEHFKKKFSPFPIVPGVPSAGRRGTSR